MNRWSYWIITAAVAAAVGMGAWFVLARQSQQERAAQEARIHALEQKVKELSWPEEGVIVSDGAGGWRRIHPGREESAISRQVLGGGPR